MSGVLRYMKGAGSYVLSRVPDDLGVRLSLELTAQGLVVTEYTIRSGSDVVATR